MLKMAKINRFFHGCLEEDNRVDQFSIGSRDEERQILSGAQADP